MVSSKIHRIRYNQKCFSPYLTEHLKRFGQYLLDITVQPEPLQPQRLFATTT